MTAETLKHFYQPQSIIWNSLTRQYELVIDFHIFPSTNGVAWFAKVVPCTEKGIPCGHVYRHSVNPTQDCFDGTARRIRGAKPLFGTISPETRLTGRYGPCGTAQSISVPEMEAGKPE